MADQNTANAVRRAPRKRLSLWGRVIIILCCAVVVGLALSLILFFGGTQQQPYVYATLQLTFDGAASGKAPDGYDFRLADLSSDEVINAALSASGLEGVYTAEQVRSGLVVTGTYPDNIVSQAMSYDSFLNFTANRTYTNSQFHPTYFRVKLYNSFDENLSKAKQKELLRNLLDVYQARFIKLYSQGSPEIDPSPFNLSAYDYPQELQLLQQRMDLISANAWELYERDPSFRYAGSSFNDIVSRIRAILSSEVDRMNADMTLNALTKNPDRLKAQYEYKLHDLENRLKYNLQRIASLDILIDSYQKSEILYISTSDSLTKIDGNSSETYDSLLEIRKRVADDNSATESLISMYRLKLSDLLDGVEELAESSIAVGATDDAEPVSDAEAPADDETSGNSVDSAPATETPAAVDKRKATPLTEEEKKTKSAAFEQELMSLEEKCNAVVEDFSAMVKAWNESKLNELTVSISSPVYRAPGVLSNAFILKAIKTTGPIVALAAIACLIMIIAVKKREEKYT